MAAKEYFLSEADVFPLEALSTEARDAAAMIRNRIGPAPIDLAVILGTGLGPLADAVEDAVIFPYDALPGFPGGAGVTGHAKRLVIGMLEGKHVAMLQGRAHYYEHGNAQIMLKPLETLHALGISTLFLTNSAGGLREEWGTGGLASISDHIAFSGMSPLFGMEGDRRFVPMNACYDPELRAKLSFAAAKTGIALHEGVYMWFSGPTFETPAEIRMARILGADLVGMSTVPETILARYLGMRVVATSSITNLGAGMSTDAPSHAETKDMAVKIAGDLSLLMRAFLKEF